MVMRCILILLAFCSQTWSTITDDDREPQIESQVSAKQVVWYIHLQKNFVPYSQSLSDMFEAEYQKYLVDSFYGVGSDFVIQSPDSRTCVYFINFEEMLQKRKTRQYLYRTVRRIVFSRALTTVERNRPIPLAYWQITAVGGHPWHYLSKHELDDKTVANESTPEFSWYKSLVVEDSLSKEFAEALARSEGETGNEVIY